MTITKITNGFVISEVVNDRIIKMKIAGYNQRTAVRKFVHKISRMG